MSELEETFAFQLRAAKLGGWRREVRFAHPRRWRFDFAWEAAMVAVEVEGGSYVAGRHTRGPGFESDCEKLDEAQLLGWTVLRVTGAMVEDGRALALLERALARR